MGRQFETAVNEKLELWKKNGRTGFNYSDAVEDVVCDALEPIMTDGSLIDKLIEYSGKKPQGKGLIQTIRDFFRDLHNKLIKLHERYKNNNPDDRAGYFFKQHADLCEQLADKCAKALAEVNSITDENISVAETTGSKSNIKSTKNIRYSFRNSKSGMAHDSLLPYNSEMSKLIEKTGNVIVDSYEKLVEQVNRAFEKPNEKATLYFGILGSDLIKKINDKTPNIPKTVNGNLFKQGREYSIAATLDSIRHLADNKKGITREDVIDYLDRFADTIIDNDSVSFDVYIDNRSNKNNGLLFKKQFDDGVIETFNLISNKRKTLGMITIYMENADYIKRKSATTPLLQNTVAHTPKAREGQTFKENSNTEFKKNQEKFSDRDSDGNTSPTENPDIRY